MRDKLAPSFTHLGGSARHAVERDHTSKWDHQRVIHYRPPIPLCYCWDGMFSTRGNRLVCRSSSRFNSSTKASNFCGSRSFRMASHSCFQGVSVKLPPFCSDPSCRTWYLHLPCQ